MKTYTAIAHLASPICSGPGVFAPLFESLLAWAWWAARQEVLFQSLHIPLDERIDFAAVLPLEYRSGVAVASSMIYEKEAPQYSDFWRKGWHDADDDLVDFGKDKPKIHVGRGWYKNFLSPLNLTVLTQVSWTFRSPDVAAVIYLLDHVPGVGKKVSAGHGEVERWEVVETPGASIVRPVPVRLAGDGGELAVCGWRPPVWEPDNQELCVIKDLACPHTLS